ncbi:hypothetical protein ACFV0W_30010, partial [Streptomyces anulatus]
AVCQERAAAPNGALHVRRVAVLRHPAGQEVGDGLVRRVRSRRLQLRWVDRGRLRIELRRRLRVLLGLRVRRRQRQRVELRRRLQLRQLQRLQLWGRGRRIQLWGRGLLNRSPAT